MLGASVVGTLSAMFIVGILREPTSPSSEPPCPDLSPSDE
jgi:hypothetical protein